MEVVTLKNGIRVGNFSSPHAFLFDDGSVLPGVDAKTSQALMLEAHEVETPVYEIVDGITKLWYTNIELEFYMTEEVDAAIRAAHDEDVDIILVPFPVLQAVKACQMLIGKLRVCRVTDRVMKTISSDKFCI